MSAYHQILSARPRARPLPPPMVAEITDEFVDVPRRRAADYLRLLYRHRRLAGLCFAGTLGLTMLVTLCLPRKYTASTVIQVSRQSPIQLRLDGNVLRLEDSDRDVNGVSSFIATQVTALESLDLAERVIRNYDLAENPAFTRASGDRTTAPALGDGVVGDLRPRRWEEPAPAATPGSPEGKAAPEAAPAPVDPRLIEQYVRYLWVQDVRGTDLIRVGFTTRSPSLSAFLAAAHTQAYVDTNEDARRATHVAARDFLGQQLGEARDAVARAEAALNAFAAENPKVAVDQEQKVVAQRVAQLSAQHTEAEATRIGLETQHEFLRRPGGDLLPYFLDRPGIQRLHLSGLDIRAQRAALADRLGPRHPEMVELQRQERELQQQLVAEVGREVTSIRSRYDAALLREHALRDELEQQEEAAVARWGLGARFALLKRDVETARTLHESLLKQQLETGVNSQLVTSNVRVVERADVPVRPSQPKMRYSLAFGLLAGLVLALGVPLAREHLDHRVKDPRELEDLLQLGTVGVIPNFGLTAAREGRGGDPAGPCLPALRENTDAFTDPRSMIAEAFRGMRTAILSRAAPPKVIVVTSAGPAEGKTVVAVNLAIALTETGARVVLIDADLWRPACHKALRVVSTAGLSTVLAGEAPLDAVTRQRGPRLAFIPAGPIPPNSAELVGSPRMRGTLGELADRYDFIVIDTPPVLPVTDGVVLASAADGVLLVVKARETPREVVHLAHERLRLAGANLLGLVVNDVDLGWGDLRVYSRYYGAYSHGPPGFAEPT